MRRFAVLALLFCVGCHAGLKIGVDKGGTAKAKGPVEVEGGVLFSFSAPDAKSVNLAGEFNSWSNSQTPMSDPNHTGVWQVTIPLEAGKYAYKFVIDGGVWQEDPNNPEKTDDGYGGFNSVVNVGKGAAAKKVAPASQASPSLSPPKQVQGGILFRFYSPGSSVVYLAGEFNSWSASALPMADPDKDGIWEVIVPLAPGRYEYKFVVEGRDWKEDPGNPDKVSDPYGGSNSVLTVE
ncbi:MAG: hypothetical protein QME66_01125 [Candidatus Eisenbacteria bacterium]|nr:hypothetical protein [Candidatus Eisenbacteria bacterium]